MIVVQSLPDFYKQETETEKEAVIVQGDFPPSPTSLSSSGAPRRPEDPGSPVYSVPPALYPKPWLGAQPATVVTPGVNVTLRCRAPQPAWRFGLFKLGEIGPPLFRDVSSELAEFFLEEVTPAQGGSYHCCYRRPDWRPGIWSQPSDPLELLVTGEVLGSGRRSRWNKGGGGGTERYRERESKAGKLIDSQTQEERHRDTGGEKGPGRQKERER